MQKRQKKQLWEGSQRIIYYEIYEIISLFILKENPLKSTINRYKILPIFLYIFKKFSMKLIKQ